ncbi:CLUMA_CG018553, isoform A [Clunio marinus]|uniref:CLUMA_CG018553, isoform A n=1 Tax=Clunio marinus TaxID=568069 RepID=A0A1J1IXZ9_9DIPT|nr:CLUMA_CG018553, isoform A [Clunio marinus]
MKTIRPAKHFASELIYAFILGPRTSKDETPRREAKKKTRKEKRKNFGDDKIMSGILHAFGLVAMCRCLVRGSLEVFDLNIQTISDYVKCQRSSLLCIGERKQEIN